MRTALVNVEAGRLSRDAALASFVDATPELMARRELLSRVDSKFVVSAELVAPKIWLTAGAEYQPGDVAFDLFYRLVTGQRDPTEPNGHVLGLGVHYAF